MGKPLGEKKPNDHRCWAQITIKGEINETKPTILCCIYLQLVRPDRILKVPEKSPKNDFFALVFICLDNATKLLKKLDIFYS
ncbi:MAG: hypothetical protein CMQ28_03200 [Gammaproteobacteria bacterium]|nr:hypothetical protein [Gammaproteobacteria bacterium]